MALALITAATALTTALAHLTKAAAGPWPWQNNKVHENSEKTDSTM